MHASQLWISKGTYISVKSLEDASSCHSVLLTLLTVTVNGAAPGFVSRLHYQRCVIARYKNSILIVSAVPRECFQSFISYIIPQPHKKSQRLELNLIIIIIIILL